MRIAREFIEISIYSPAGALACAVELVVFRFVLFRCYVFRRCVGCVLYKSREGRERERAGYEYCTAPFAGVGGVVCCSALCAERRLEDPGCGFDFG